MYKVFCDGASRSNPGEAAIGVSIQENDDEIHTISEAIGIASNNVAEYKSLIFALQYSLEKNYLNLEIFLDSKLVVEQINIIVLVKPHGGLSDATGRFMPRNNVKARYCYSI